MKVDLVMWTKNGEGTLQQVLRRIDEVIPHENIGQKIIVDDHSQDRTREIAEEFNWQVYLNPSGGVSGGANEALRHVKSKFFVSFEQDLLLSKDWWLVVPDLLSMGKVAIASGIRLPDKPLSIRRLQVYIMNRYKKEYLRGNFVLYGKSLDNTIYKTNVLRAVGGFPTLSVSGGIDTVLAYTMQKRNFEWKVAWNVVSTHMRKSLRDELKHYYWYGTCQPELWKVLGDPRDKFFAIVKRTMFSPFRGLTVALNQRCLDLIYVYPLVRLYVLRGTIDGLKESEVAPRYGSDDMRSETI